MKKTLLLLGMIAILSITALAQKQVNLNLKKGDSFTMVTEMDQEIKQSIMGSEMIMNINMDMEIELEVQGMDDESITFSQVYKKMSVEMVSPMQGMDLKMDSSEPENEFNKPLKSLMDKEILVNVDFSGKVLSVNGLDDILNDLGGMSAGGADFAQFLDKEAIEKNYQTLFPVEYGKSYKKGDTWEMDSSVGGDIAVNMNSVYSATEVSKKAFSYDIITSMEMEGTQEASGMEMDMDLSGEMTGNGILNMKTGLISTYMLDGTIKGVMSMKANEQMPMDMEIPMSIKQSSTTTLK